MTFNKFTVYFKVINGPEALILMSESNFTVYYLFNAFLIVKL